MMNTDQRHVTIIAEAGVNHNGSLEMARQMVLAAHEAGADYVKFQTAVPELVISSIADKAEYQKSTTGSDESQLDMCRAILFQNTLRRENQPPLPAPHCRQGDTRHHVYWHVHARRN